MKILVFSNLPPHVMGGAENQVARLVTAWLKSGNHVEVAGHRIPSSRIALGDFNIQTHCIRTLQNCGRIIRAATYFISVLFLLFKIHKKFDIIYCRGLGDAAISTCAAKALGVTTLPLVVCPINAKGEGDAKFIKSIPGWRWIVHLINRQCNAINIIAPAIVDDLNSLHISISEVTFIPNGIPIYPLPKHHQPNNIIKFIFAGRLSRQKGLDILIRALSEIKKKEYDFSLHIVGEGPLKGELETLINNLALAENIYLCGKVSTEEIRNTLLQHDVFLLPSRYEGMSNAALEAMEAGLPVLVTQCGGIDQYIKSNIGWVCEPNDLKSLSDSLNSILKTPPENFICMGRKARLLVESNFEINNIANKNLILFRKIISIRRNKKD